MKDSQNRIKIYALGSFIVLALCMILSATMFSFQYIGHERERADIFSRQIEHFFEFEYRAMTEEAWTKNYESVVTRVTQIGHQLGSKQFKVKFLDNQGLCLGYFDGDSYSKSCPSKPKSAKSTEAFIQTEDRIQVHPPRASNNYLVVVNLMIGGSKIGTVFAEISDPFGFERRGFFRFFIDKYLAYIVALLGIWVGWQIISGRYLLRPYLIDMIAIEKKDALGKLAQRLVHDIRSPLETLLFLVRDARGLPEIQRRQLKAAASRIQSLGDEIIVRHSQCAHKGDQGQTFTYEVINSIIAEKTVQLEGRRLFEIKSEIAEATLLTTVAISPSDLARIFSNLVNNAVEASDDMGSVLILQRESRLSRDAVEIVVRDKGKGMSAEVLGAVRTRGGSFGKVGGAGIGLQHAKEVVAMVGGSVDIDSLPGRGTDVILTLPRLPNPDWLPNSLSFSAEATIVVIDDDESTHILWSEKLRDFKLIHLYDPQDFNPNQHMSEKFWYVIDFEFSGSLVTGMDMIEKYKLGDRAILVTSYFNDLTVQKSVSRARCKLLPKFMIPQISVGSTISNTIVSGREASSGLYDLVLIDDDELVHELWAIEAEMRSLKVFHIDKLAQVIDLDLSKSIPIFIDKNLGQEWDGLGVAKFLAKSGYSEIYLATGEPNCVGTETYIKAVLGKGFPFEQVGKRPAQGAAPTLQGPP